VAAEPEVVPVINAEFFDLQGHARHLKYAALACPHREPQFRPKTPKEAAMHCRALQAMGRTLLVCLTARWMRVPEKGAKDFRWFWHVALAACGKPDRSDLESAVRALLGSPRTLELKKTDVLYWKAERGGGRHGFVKIGKRLPAVRLPKGL